MTRRQRVSLGIAICVLILVAMIGARELLVHRWHANLVERRTVVAAAANPMIDAIERYRADTGGKPPAGLGDLVPKYIAAVPAVPYGADGWGYYTWGTQEHGHHFGLSVRFNDEVLDFSSASKMWMAKDPNF